MLQIVLTKQTSAGQAEAGGVLHCDVLLYTGLGVLATGLLVTAVGLGEKGFTAVELRMAGPGTVGCGLALILLRLVLCMCTQCTGPGREREPRGPGVLFERRIGVTPGQRQQ